MVLTLETKYLKAINKSKLADKYQKSISKILKEFQERTCPDAKMLGWLDYPTRNFDKLIGQMDDICKRWKKLKVTDVVVVGIGGSYTGVRAILDFVIPDQSKRKMNIHFLSSMTSTTVLNTIASLKDKSWATIVVSKSGTTLESALNFRLVRENLKDTFSKDYGQRIVAITDPENGVLHDLCVKHGYEMLPIDPSIGGRFSTLTSVGLLPAMLAGVDVKLLLKGALKAHKELSSTSLKSNSALAYATYRHYLYSKCGYDVEVFMTYEDFLEYTCIQHRQLFGESEGKNNNSLFPTYSILTTDLHSMGQLYQEGKKIFFETILIIDQPKVDTVIKKSTFQDDDKLDYLTNKTLNEINYSACKATIQAHANAGREILQVKLKDTSETSFGYLYYWLSLAAAVSARLLKHNAFNQPGVEAYKKLMFKLLGRK